MYTINELALKVNVSRLTIVNMIKDGRLPAGIELGPAKTSPVRLPRKETDAAIALRGHTAGRRKATLAHLRPVTGGKI